MDNEDINFLLGYMLKNNYNRLCQRLKVEILDCLINYMNLKNLDVLDKNTLIKYRDIINKLRRKDKQKHLNLIVNAISEMIIVNEKLMKK